MFEYWPNRKTMTKTNNDSRAFSLLRQSCQIILLKKLDCKLAFYSGAHLIKIITYSKKSL